MSQTPPPSDDPRATLATVLDDEADVDRQVESLLESEALPGELAPAVSEQEPADAADTLERLEHDEQLEVVGAMSARAAADALAHMELPLAIGALIDIPPEEAAEYLALMEPDDAVDLLQGLDKDLRTRILNRMHPRKAAILGKLVLYDAETAGGVMTTHIAVVRADLRIGSVIDNLKRSELDPAQHQIYCVDDQKRLVGVIGLRDLLVTDDDQPVADHMITDFMVTRTEVDREDVARVFERYDMLTLPVVDDHNRVLGMITIDDVVDIIQAEATEDALKQAGAGSDEAAYSPLSKKLKGRLPWLVVNLGTATLAASIIAAFEGVIAAIPVAAVIFPIIANQSGNAGYQSLAVTLRGLVLGNIHRDQVRKLVARELIFGMVAGVAVGVVVFAVLLLVGAIGSAAASEALAQFTWRLALIAGSSMAACLAVACLVGTAIPLILDRVGVDPATASSIFLTMLADIVAFAVFLGLVALLRNWLITPETNALAASLCS